MCLRSGIKSKPDSNLHQKPFSPQALTTGTRVGPGRKCEVRVRAGIGLCVHRTEVDFFFTFLTFIMIYYNF